ncbi:flagellar biosynthesis anti-sigma factor FlgM [Colwellia sp. MSW7]|jgi:negative regulator of flagellin synthesis FlgM|uniref:Negative regulator of flagellin synthesis n=1 Tax=Colwellia maritima TaxID=2912588 RepID=A0ABS9X382_9GAMM|nr:flagellar biosynthesis anti-sigma factor FlgM [Colwellia maritima]MCI2284634.1 flagellar biosynthesis anti-sigma factor FlgM [Colwellia maritima]
MTININNLNNKTQVHQNQQTQVKQDASQAATTNTQVKHAAHDSVSLTPQAKQLSELQKKANDLPTIDQQKIDELRKTIASGDYKIDPQKLAASIASFEFDLL